MEEPREERWMSKRSLLIIGVLLILVFIGFWDDIQDIFLFGTTEGEGWETINTRIVEKTCLAQAKKVAVDEGYSELFVLDCNCIALESKVLKNYDCDVSTIDVLNPARKVIVHCYRQKNECTVASDKGLETYDFDDLETFING
jgi:hypothetical protein